MEISLREWLIVLGMVAIVLIAIDGLRRFRGQRERNPLRVKIDKNVAHLPETNEEEVYRSELPNGGARVRQADPQTFASALERLKGIKGKPKAKREHKEPSVSAKGLAGLEVHVDPLLDHPAEVAAPVTRVTHASSSTVSPTGSAEASVQPSVEVSSNAGVAHSHIQYKHFQPLEAKSAPTTQPASTEHQRVEIEADSTSKMQLDSTVDAVQPVMPQEQAPLKQEQQQSAAEVDPWDRPITELMEVEEPLLSSEKLRAEEQLAEEKAQQAAQSEVVVEESVIPTGEGARVVPMRNDPLAELKRQARIRVMDAGVYSTPADEYIVISVSANDPRGFNGEQLLQVVFACGMRFGERSVFHRHELGVSKGPVQFSMANMTEPGSFDLDRIEQLQTPGVTFFMSLPGANDLMNAFECMVATAQCVAKNLSGELKDENHSVMRPQTIEHCRQRIREYERRRLATQHRRQHM